MKIVQWEKGYRSPYGVTILTVGNFDGVHVGHREIFHCVVEKANELKGTPAVLTFNPHPQHFFSRGEPPLITDFERRAELIASCGIEVLFVAGRTKDFYEMSAEDFVTEVLVKSLKMKYIFVGHDFTFGKGRTGNIDLLMSLGRHLGFGVEEKAAVSVEGMIVSSTMVRNLVQAGNVAQAAKLLGREFSVKGPVIRGVGRGRQLGFPTANIDYGATLMPPFGVYIVRVVVAGKHFWGVANLGDNPTFGAKKLSFEVYILDFDRDIYDTVIEVGFVDRIRDEIKFSNPEKLIGQIRDDIETARRIIKYYETRL